MKKLFLVFIAVFSFIAQASAQSSVMATLHHDGDIKTFYGTSALRQAHEEAAHGDVITLSSGTFVSTNITKAITLRGAGMGLDSISGTEPTMLTGDFKITIANDSTLKDNDAFTMEGIYHYDDIILGASLINPQFIKCYLYRVNYSSTYYSIIKGTFIHCFLRALDIYVGSASLFNCYVNDPEMYSKSTTASFEFQNCVIRTPSLYNLCRSIFRNCFIYGCYGTINDIIDASSTAFDCVGVVKDNTISMFKYIPNTSNKQVSSVSEVFKTWTGTTLGSTSLSTEKLELKDDAKTKYLGNDGTEIGIYGGSIPFVASPSNPQITKLNVASKSTADGKLSVDIEVKAAE